MQLDKVTEGFQILADPVVLSLLCRPLLATDTILLTSLPLWYGGSGSNRQPGSERGLQGL